MSPALIEALLDVDRRAQAAGHGNKEAVYAAACQHLGLSRATLMRRIKDVTVQPDRKRRSDAGETSFSQADAVLLSATMMEGYRANDKSIIKLRLALTMLRANRPGFACTVDQDTGEIRELSESACARALRTYKLHPEQLRQPEPVQALASAHPNDVWQIDASISTLFYVPEGGVADMDKAVYYKNKPENFEKIKRQRLTRYVLTDHCSGAIFVLYVPGGESIVNMAEAFLAAIQQRPQQQMYGVPYRLMMDPGSAGIGGAFKALLRRLQVEAVVNEVGNARAKGQVENAHNLVELNFESGFKLTHVPSIAWINEQAASWMRYYNSVKVHSRHGMPRWNKWMQITEQQLRLVDGTLARELLTHEPATPKVDRELQVRFAGRVWSVKDVPGVLVGEKLSVTYNPFKQHAAYVMDRDVDGNELLIEIPEVKYDEHGFAESAALIGREHKSLGDTDASANRKLVERVATGALSNEQAKASRKAKQLPFGGTVDPYKHLEDLPAVTMLPRKGTELQPAVATREAPAAILNRFEIATRLRAMGMQMDREKSSQIQAWYPDGIREDQLQALFDRLTVRAGLRVVAGGGA
ncbi:MAG: transposase [Comamonas sp.]